MRVLSRRGLPSVQAHRVARDPRLRHDPSECAGRSRHRQRTVAGLCVRRRGRAARDAAVWRGRPAPVLRKRFAVPEAVPVKITHHWMREFVPLELTPAALSQRLTLAGLEVEAVTPVAPPFSGVVVGEVLAVSRHPNAEKLSLCEVTTDGSNRLQIVCGAPNVRGGLKVAVAMVGAQLPGGITIKRAKLRGIESNGMLCSARELGLGQEQDGIMELAVGLPLGIDVREALDLDDTALEVNATPNRGDCMSVCGLARDYAAAHEGRYLTYTIEPVVARHAAVFPTRIEASAACPVFASRVVGAEKVAGHSPQTPH